MRKNYIIDALLIIMALLGSFFIYNSNKNYIYKDYDSLDLSVKNLMIVAHPSDELLWGGAHLIEDDYIVVCITCGLDEKKVEEFQSVIKETNDQLITLGYPDKVLGIKSNWHEEKEKITQDLKKILELNDWNIIVTHNKDGEYGNIQNKLTNRYVTEIYDELNLNSNLYYFGEFYKESKYNELEIKPEKIGDELLSQKIEILKKYKSQNYINETFNHMLPHENWNFYEKK